jgi:hypothetical protein
MISGKPAGETSIEELRKQIDAIKKQILPLITMGIASVSITVFPKHDKKQPLAKVRYMGGGNAIDVAEYLDQILLSNNKSLTIIALLEILSLRNRDNMLEELRARTCDVRAESLVDEAASLMGEYKQYTLACGFSRSFTREVQAILTELRETKKALKHSPIKKLFDIADNGSKQHYLREAIKILRVILVNGSHIDDIERGKKMILQLIDQHSEYIETINAANNFFKSTPGKTDTALRRTLYSLNHILYYNVQDIAQKDKIEKRVLGHFLGL